MIKFIETESGEGTTALIVQGDGKTRCRMFWLSEEQSVAIVFDDLVNPVTPGTIPGDNVEVHKDRSVKLILPGIKTVRDLMGALEAAEKEFLDRGLVPDGE